jgi:hypothetical protein
MIAKYQNIRSLLVLLQVHLTAYDVRGDKIPRAIPLHGPGVRFVNPTEQEVEGYKTAMRAASGAPARYAHLREGERQHAHVYCVQINVILRH